MATRTSQAKPRKSKAGKASKSKSRQPLSREKVFAAAVKLADTEGLSGLTMRRLADELGVEAMSLYYHVANKEAVLDGIVDAIVEEIAAELGGLDVPEGDWKQNLRHRILTAREVVLRHPWATAVFESRTQMSPLLMHYFDTSLGIMIEGGFSYDLGHRAMHALGSRMLGFNQELFTPDDDSSAGDDDLDEMMEAMAEQLPYMTSMIAKALHQEDPSTTLGFCDYQVEFEFGIDLILNGLEGRLVGPNS